MADPKAVGIGMVISAKICWDQGFESLAFEILKAAGAVRFALSDYDEQDREMLRAYKADVRRHNRITATKATT